MTALRFDHLRSTHERTEPCRGVVLHWTGGVRPPAGVYETLRARKGPRSPDGLSIHYVIGSDGEVVQMAALDRVCLHAGAVNAWTVGIEMVSPGLARGAAYDRELARGIVRPVYEERLRGARRGVPTLGLTAPQERAMVDLVEDLVERLSLPRVVPLDPDGGVLRREMTAAERSRFAGVMGHYHVHPTKRDPGSMPLEALRVRWLPAA